MSPIRSIGCTLPLHFPFHTAGFNNRSFLAWRRCSGHKGVFAVAVLICFPTAGAGGNQEICPAIVLTTPTLVGHAAATRPLRNGNFDHARRRMRSGLKLLPKIHANCHLVQYVHCTVYRPARYSTVFDNSVYGEIEAMESILKVLR